MTTRSGFRTKSAAKTEMKRIEAQVANDTFFDDTSTKDYTVQEVYELFHAGYKYTVKRINIDDIWNTSWKSYTPLDRP